MLQEDQVTVGTTNGKNEKIKITGSRKKKEKVS